jgi:hypothetical protein
MERKHQGVLTLGLLDAMLGLSNHQPWSSALAAYLMLVMVVLTTRNSAMSFPPSTLMLLLLRL